MYSVVVPILNEVENVRKLISRLGTGPTEILFCDNGSTDGSVALVKELLTSDTRIRLSQGTGSVTAAVYRGIREAKYGKVVVMDGDLSHPPELADRVASLLDCYDMVFASRNCRGAGSNDSAVNKFFSFGLNILTYFLAPDIKDRSTGFFGVRKALVLNPLKSSCKPALEILVRNHIVSTCEIPYVFDRRVSGTSKLGRGLIVLRTLRDLFLLYCYKYRKIIKYAVVGALGTSIYLGLLAFFTEVCGIWYMVSAVMGTLAAFLFNFTFNNIWTFSERSRKASEPDYEYYSWYKGNYLQRTWKHKIAYRTLDIVRDLKSNNILDVGCGSSPLLGMLPGEPTGLDKDLDKLGVQKTRCPKRTKLINWDLSSDNKLEPTKAFDCIICNNVLEHLGDPMKAIAWMSDCLAPRGVLIVTVPDCSRKTTSLVEYLYGKAMPKAYAPDHYFKFKPSLLDSICKNHRLVLVDKFDIYTDMMRVYVKEWR